MAKGLQAAEGINCGETGADDKDGIALADFVERISGKDIFDMARCLSAQPVEYGRPRGGWMPGRKDQNVGHDDCAVSPAYPPLFILSLDDPNDIADVSNRATVEMGRKLRLHESSEIAAPSKDAFRGHGLWIDRERSAGLQPVEEGRWRAGDGAHSVCCDIQADIDILDIIGEATSELLAGLEDCNLFNVPNPALHQKFGNNRARVSAADDCDTGAGARRMRLQSRGRHPDLQHGSLPVRGW